MEANAGKSFQMQIIFNIFPRISLHCKLVPVQYWEYEYSLFITITIAITTYPTKLGIFQNGWICNLRQWLCQYLISFTKKECIFRENCHGSDELVTGLHVFHFGLYSYTWLNKSRSRCAVVRFCWPLVWLHTELDSTQSHYHYELQFDEIYSCCFELRQFIIG